MSCKKKKSHWRHKPATNNYLLDNNFDDGGLYNYRFNSPVHWSHSEFRIFVYTLFLQEDDEK